MLHASRAIAKRADVLVSSVLLTAFGMALCEAEGVPLVSVQMSSLNRLTKASRQSIRFATSYIPVLCSAAEDVPFAKQLPVTAHQQLKGHMLANADPLSAARTSAEVLGDLHETAVSFARFNFINEHLAGPAIHDWHATDTKGSVEFGPNVQRGPKYMLQVAETRDQMLLTLRWRDDTGWHQVAEAMLRHIEELIIDDAAE